MDKKGPIESLIDFAYGFFLDKSAEPGGAGKLKVGFHKELGSGYNIEVDREERAQKLKDICIEVVSDPDYNTRDITGDGIKETFCNHANARVAQEMGCNEILPTMLARNQILHAENSEAFRKVDAKEASEHAKRGGYGFAGMIYAHSSHVAAIFPANHQYSGSLVKYVPIVANVGRHPNGIKKVSAAFPPSKGEPDYYIYGEA